MVGWIAFSVIYGVGLSLGASPNPTLQAFVYLFGAVFYFSLPVAVVAEIIRWRRKRKR
jgi:hypothetical protein